MCLRLRVRTESRPPDDVMTVSSMCVEVVVYYILIGEHVVMMYVMFILFFCVQHLVYAYVVLQHHLSVCCLVYQRTNPFTVFFFTTSVD